MAPRIQTVWQGRDHPRDVLEPWVTEFSNVSQGCAQPGTVRAYRSNLNLTEMTEQ